MGRRKKGLQPTKKWRGFYNPGVAKHIRVERIDRHRFIEGSINTIIRPAIFNGMLQYFKSKVNIGLYVFAAEQTLVMRLFDLTLEQIHASGFETYHEFEYMWNIMYPNEEDDNHWNMNPFIYVIKVL